MAAKFTHLTLGTDGAEPIPQSLRRGQAFDATLPPTPLNALLAADGAAVYVLSNDSGFVDAVRTAAGEQVPVQRLPTLKALRSLVETGQCKIVLLDAEPFGGAVRARITELKAIEPELVVVVAAPRETAEELMGLFSERVIHRLLIKPAAIGMTRLLLESAVSRFLQLRASHEATLTEPLPEARRIRSAPAQGARSAWILATALVSVLIAGVVIGGYLRGGSGDILPASTTAERIAVPLVAPQAAADPIVGSALASATRSVPVVEIDELEAEIAALVAAVVDSDPVEAAVGTVLIADESADAATAPSELDSLLTIARARIERGQLLEPAGDSARDYLERALSLGAENEAALAMRAEVAATILDSARVELESGNVRRATSLAAEARRLDAASETLARLEADLAAARAAAAERRAAAERALGQLLDTGRARMQQGRLITPERDNAFFYLQRLRAGNPNYPGLEAAWTDLGTLLARHADTAIADQNWTGAEAWIAALANVAERATVDAARENLAAARLQDEYLAKPAAAGEMRLLSAGQVAYPENAQRRDLEGWAQTEFIVGIDGVPRRARVVDSHPTGWFEEAALAAVAGYRYEPFERDGRLYERLVRLTLRFELE